MKMKRDKDLLLEYRNKFKENIKSTIDNKDFKLANKLIAEYEDIINNDIDIFSMKAVIKIYENDLENAIEIINNGLNFDYLNTDLIYNKAYVQYLRENIEESILCYKKIYRYTNDYAIKNEVKLILQEQFGIKVNEDIDVEKITFIVFCPGWGAILKRSHHMATTLSKYGYNVHSISTVDHINDGINDIMDYRHNYKGVNIHTIFRNRNYKEVEREFVSVTQSIIDSVDHKVVFITQNPNDYFILQNITGNFEIIYECVDDNTDLENAFWANSRTIDWEQEIMNRASIITTVSTSLYINKSLVEKRKNVFLLKNAVDKNIFDNNCSCPEEFNNIPKPIILHTGIIYDRFDEELLYKLVRNNRDKSFVMVGDIRNNEMLNDKEPNLYILGAKPHDELKNYMRFSDVGIVPLRDNTDMAINCDSIKIYEYLASGIPVVTTKLPDVSIFNKEYIKTASNYYEFDKCINDVLSIKLNYIDMNEFVESNTWDKRVQFLLESLRGNINTEVYHTETIRYIRNKFRDSINKDYHPSIESSYAMTYFLEDINKCLKLTKQAYSNLQINHTYRNYVQSVLKSGNLKTAVDLIIKDINISEEHKAELIYFDGNEDLQLFIVKLLLRDYNYLKNNLNNTYKAALYNFEIMNYDESGELYIELCGDISKPMNTPIVNLNISKLLARTGSWKSSEQSYFNHLDLVDKYLNRENRLQRHRFLFDIEVKECYLCNGKKYNLVTTRPDGIDIVKCENCGLTFTSKKPSEKNLIEIYKYENYYNGGICGYRFGYDNLDKSLMFKNRANWINNSACINKKNILDIGCSTGEFLEEMKTNGWNVNGIEISEYAYDMCISKGIAMYNKSLIECKFNTANFDCITLWSVLEHYTNPIRELEEVYRVLNKNGKLYIAVPNNTRATLAGENCAEYNLSYEHLIYFDSNPLIQMLMKVGFKIEQCFYGDLIHLYDMKPTGTHIYVCATK